MSFKFSAWAIRNPTPVVLLFVALTIAGVLSYRALPIKLFPDISFPVVQVSIALPGAAASEVESQITREVEATVSNVPGVAHVHSTVTQGLSLTFVDFEIGEKAEKSTDEVRAAVDRIRGNLPRSTEQPVVLQLDTDLWPIVTYAISSERLSDLELSTFVDNIVARRLIAEPGVAQVARVGGVEREVNVTLKPDRLEALGLTAPQVNNALRSSSIDVPGGRAEVGGREQTIRVLGSADSVAALGDHVIATGSGHEVRLSDVATIALGAAERRGFAALNGHSVVGFQVMKTKEASDVATARATAGATAELSAEFPHVRFERILSTATSTQDSFSATLRALIEGMALASLVILFFLRDWRATTITALAMPMSLIPTFAVMELMGFSLNIVSMLALSLIIGILVDDAIVEVENIQKRVERGESPYNAALVGADEIGLAVVATTLAIVAVFVPVAAIGGHAGAFLREFGFTVAVAVLCSLLVARLFTPLLAAYFMKPVAHPRERKPFEGAYRKALEYALAHRWLSVALGAAVFLGSITLAATLPVGFMSAQDNGTVSLTVEGAPGATLLDMRRSVSLLTKKLRDMPDVQSVFTVMGSGGSHGNVRSGRVTVLLKPGRSQPTQEFTAGLTPFLFSIPDVRLAFDMENGSGDGVMIFLASEDAALLGETALKVEQQMRELPSLRNVHQFTPRPGSELVISPKPAEAARLGVTADVLGSIARVATLGDFDSNSAWFNTGQQRLPIRVRLPDAARANLETLQNLRVPTAGGAMVPLSAVADVRFQPGVARIERFDRKRHVRVMADLNGASLGEAFAAIHALPIMQNLPEGVIEPPFGQGEQMALLFSSFGSALLAGIGLIFGVLVLLFRSFFLPATILAALPLSLAGAFLGLLMTGSELNLSALIGLLMLMGLAAKNSILLVEFANRLEREGVAQKEALIRACRERARPIVMTTVAMATGMLPTALALGAGAEFRAPMAIAVIGGLISSTVLSLVLVPVVYQVVDDFEQWIKPFFARLIVQPAAHDGTGDGRITNREG